MQSRWSRRLAIGGIVVVKQLQQSGLGRMAKWSHLACINLGWACEPSRQRIVNAWEDVQHELYAHRRCVVPQSCRNESRQKPRKPGRARYQRLRRKRERISGGLQKKSLKKANHHVMTTWILPIKLHSLSQCGAFPWSSRSFFRYSIAEVSTASAIRYGSRNCPRQPKLHQHQRHLPTQISDWNEINWSLVTKMKWV